MPRFLVLLILAVATISCGQSSRKSPIEYNDTIVNEQYKIIAIALDMSQAAWEDVDRAMELREALELQANESYHLISQLKPFGTDSRFLDTAMRLFGFYVEVSANQYVEMLEIIKNKGEELTFPEMERLDELIVEATQKEQILDGMFIRAQQDFARKHGLEIKESELQQRIDSL